jgi:hypothetical protein
LKFDSENERITTKQRLMDSTTALNQISDRRYSFEEIAIALQEGFRKALGGVCLDI